MKSKLLPILTTGLIFCATQQHAQVSAYSFTQSLSTYSASTTGTLVGGLFQDDDVTIVSIPFTFTFNGTPYTSMDVCSNGYLSFSALTGTIYSPISDNSTSEIISPFGNDLMASVLISADITAGSNTLTNCSSVLGYSVGDLLVDYNNDFNGNPVMITAINGNNIVVSQNAASTIQGYDVANTHGLITSKLSGTSPNRVFTIEFRNFTRYFTYDELINFRVNLYETSNKIEFLYGDCVSGQEIIPSEVGLKGMTSSDFNSRSVGPSVSWTFSSPAFQNNDVCAFQNGVVPATGLSYVWTPVTCNVSVAATSSMLCTGNSATLTASGATSYTWTSGPTASINVVSPSTDTTYTVTGATGACTSSATYSINVNTSPTVTANSSNSLTCPGQTAVISAGGAVSYSLNGVAGSGSTFTVNPGSTTIYTVSGAAGLCVSTATVLQDVNCTSLAKVLPANLNVEAYPNPFNTSLTLKNTENKELSISISDALGKVVFTAKLKPASIQDVPVASLQSGLYFVTIKDSTSSLTRKLIKE